jgi:hypothetical protein
MVVSFKKTADCQYRRNDHNWSSLGHRRLRFSFQINDFKDRGTGGPIQPFNARLRRRRGFSRLGRQCQALLSKNFTSQSPARKVGGGGRLVAPDFRVKWFFLKKNLGLRRGPGGLRRRLPKEGTTPCQPDFSAILRSLEARLGESKTPSGEKPEACLFYRFRRFDWSAETMVGPPQKQGIFNPFISPVPRGLSSPGLRWPARSRARRRYTEPSVGLQAHF